jgi:chromatin structure-remodeling complex subunit RSC1/2
VFYLELLARLRSEKDPESLRPLSASINGLPAREKFPQFYQYIKDSQPPTLGSVEKHIRTNKVPDPTDFDSELCTIFSNARYWQTAGISSSDGEALPTFYGDVLGAQRLYQEISKGTGLSPASVMSPASLASVQYGPGHLPADLKEDEDGEMYLEVDLPSNRIPAARKTYLESISYKGEDLQAGTFVHLYNPTAPKLPIVGQIFKCHHLNSTGDRFVTVNWYYRPSQTNHVAERTFHEQEIFKTSLFVDHKVEDVIEEVCVLHIEDYTRGRCQNWNEEMPVYVVEHRYDVETCAFSRIKSWYALRRQVWRPQKTDSFDRKLCLPEGVIENLRLFQEPVPAPQRIKSPFVRNPVIPGPGKLSAPLIAEGEDQTPYYASLDTWPPGTGQIYGYAKMVQQKRVAPAPEPEVGDSEGIRPDLQVEDMAAMSRPPVKEIDASEEDDASNPVEYAASSENFAPLAKNIGRWITNRNCPLAHCLQQLSNYDEASKTTISCGSLPLRYQHRRTVMSSRLHPLGIWQVSPNRKAIDTWAAHDPGRKSI